MDSHRFSPLNPLGFCPRPREILIGWIMDTSNPAVFVNGGLLRMFVGRKVRAVIQVMRNDAGTVVGKSTDDQQIIVKGSPSQPLSAWVEVIGVADRKSCRSGGDAIVATDVSPTTWQYVREFENLANPHCYNQLCQLANGDYKHLLI
ncbi:Replication protein A 14 kDa subunit B-like protein [Drosera capensis]